VTEVELGDRVAMPWLGYACGTCDYCVSGRETLCLEQKNTGYSFDGGFGEYAIAYARYVVEVPEGVDSFDAAPLTCAGVTTYKAVKVAGTRSSDLVAVFGVGGLGHLAIQYAQIAGGRVIAVDLVDEKLELARELGAEFTVNAAKEDPSLRSRSSAVPTRRSHSRSHRRRSNRPSSRSAEAEHLSSSHCRRTTR
jgi:Zn-dependent alcohol dehydrogenases